MQLSTEFIDPLFNSFFYMQSVTEFVFRGAVDDGDA